MWKQLQALYDKLAALKKAGETAAADHAAALEAVNAARAKLDALEESASAEDRKAAEKALDAADTKCRELAVSVNAKADEIEELNAQISGQEVQLRAGRAFRNAGAAVAMGAALAAGPVSVPAFSASRAFDGGFDLEQTAGFESLDEFARVVRDVGIGQPLGQEAQDKVQRLYAATPGNAMSLNSDNGEGFPVPPAFRQAIWELVADDPLDLSNLVDAEPTAQNMVELAADESTPWGSAGVQARWRSEKASMTESQTDEVARVVKLNELYAFVLASDNLLSDRPRLRNRLSVKSAQAIRWKLTEAIIRGTGIGQPLGYLNAPALVSVAEDDSQDADTISVTNITNMYSRMLATSLARAVWIANTDVLPQLITLTIGDRPVYVPATGLAGAPFGTILGRPVIFTEHASTLGDQGDLMFVDPLGYYSPRRSSAPEFAESMHLFFDRGETAFRWTFRAGGQPYLSAPVAPPNSAPTKSHFVVLDERAG